MTKPIDVGGWTLTRLPDLGSRSPAALLLDEGDAGLSQVMARLSTVVPQRPVGELHEIDLEELHAALEAELGPELVTAAKRLSGRPDPSLVTDDDMAAFDD